MIEIRIATIEDAKFLFDLRNDPANRAMFTSSSSITWEDHLNWLGKKLLLDNFWIMIVIYEGKAIGQFRLDERKKVSVSLISKFKGKGLGGEVIKFCSEYFKSIGVVDLVAEVKTENISSQKAFTKAGYVLSSQIKINNELYNSYLFS